MWASSQGRTKPYFCLPDSGRQRGEDAAECFRAVLDLIGVAAVLVEKVYLEAARAEGEAALIELRAAIEQQIVVPTWRRAAGLGFLKPRDRRAAPDAGDRLYRIGARRERPRGQRARGGDFRRGVEVGPAPPHLRPRPQGAGDAEDRQQSHSRQARGLSCRHDRLTAAVAERAGARRGPRTRRKSRSPPETWPRRPRTAANDAAAASRIAPPAEALLYDRFSRAPCFLPCPLRPRAYTAKNCFT